MPTWDVESRLLRSMAWPWNLLAVTVHTHGYAPSLDITVRWT